VEQRRGSNVEKSKPAGQKALRIAQDLEAGIAMTFNAAGELYLLVEEEGESKLLKIEAGL
jgi:hypothetical protein